MYSETESYNQERGSVMLEFILVMPILLLLFGSTMLTFDLSMAKMRVQEANRNLAWMTGDRHDSGIAEKVNESVKEKFEERNQLESGFSGGTVDKFWAIGGSGHQVDKLDLGDVAKLDASDGKWGTLYSGNLELKMTQISGAYLGAIALSSVLFPMEEKTHYYESKYDLTRGEGDMNPEAVIYHRMESNDNRLTDQYVVETYKICLQPFPYNDQSLINTLISQIWSGVSGDGSTVLDLNLALPSIFHYRVLWLLAGDLDLADTADTIISGVKELFNGNVFNDIKSEIQGLTEALSSW